MPQVNGVVTSACMLERELTKLGHQVYVFAPGYPGVKSQPRVFRLPAMPFVFFPTARVTFLYPPKLIMKIKSLKLDVIHTQTEFPMGILGAFAAEAFRIPHAHTYHTMYENYVHYVAKGYLVTPRMAQRYSRVYCNRADAVIAPTEKAKNSLLSYGVVKPIRVVPTGIDFAPFERTKESEDAATAIKENLSIPPTAPVIVSVGRVAKEKSISVILSQLPALIERLPDVKMVIVGDGPERENLARLSETLGISGSVIFTGEVPWKDVGKYYQLGDAFASASVTETQGLTYLEAMAARVCVVAKADKSIENIVVADETGCLFESEAQIPDALYGVLTDASLRRKLTDAAFSRISGLSGERFGKNAEAIYEEMILTGKTGTKGTTGSFQRIRKRGGAVFNMINLRERGGAVLNRINFWERGGAVINRINLRERGGAVLKKLKPRRKQ
jgi:1,2-diacylglycerol 3-alpha-glucosyltransferase